MALTLDGTNGIVSSGSITTQSATGVIFSDSSSLTAAASPYVLKNRIINGDFRIDQRNAGASVTPTNASYTLDRWYNSLTQASKFTIQQNAGAVTPPVGFSNYAGITSSSTYSVLTGDTFLLAQNIEGFNTADLGFGTANAKTITLSFQVYSSLTGTFGGALSNSAGNRSYPFSYTISTANTWTTVSVTIAGDTSGTWIGATNGVGLVVRFGLGSGATFSATSGAWAAGNYVQPTSTVSVVGTNGATFYITGVQLEVGSTATPFERRLYNQEFINCQRYCYRITNTGATNNGSPVASGFWSNATLVATACKLPVTMRSAPTLSYSAIGDIQCLDRDVAWRAGGSSLVINEAGVDGVNVGLVCITGSTQGFGTVMEVRVVSGWIQFSAEL